MNLAVGAFINGLSPKQGSKLGVDKEKPVIPGPTPSRRYDESDIPAVEDDDDEIEALRRELDEIEKSFVGTPTSVPDIDVSALLLRVRSFVVKVNSVHYFSLLRPEHLFVGSPLWASKEIFEKML